VSAPTIPDPVTGYLSRQSVADPRVVPLTGDASDRRYFRILPRQGESFVLAVNAAPFEYAALPFVNVHDLFAAMPVPVPRILGHADDLGVLALEDLGDVTLQAHLGTGAAAAHAELYRQAVGFIDTIQRRGKELASSAFIPYGIAFDVEKLTWEMDFFTKHFLEAYRGAGLTDGSRAALRQELTSTITVAT
jgi:aminoglycoside/choline kinase family phosphotransferase